MHATRRTFLRSSAQAAAAALTLGPAALLSGCGDEEAPPSGLVEDPGGLLDLPRGFQYRVLSVEGESRMLSGPAKGAVTPGTFDGMTALRGPRGTTVLVRNHELHDPGADPVPQSYPYAPEGVGGTIAVVVGPGRSRVDEYVASSGTMDNCAGGRTPWGTWLTCEETTEPGHGYVFEVDPASPEDARSRMPIRPMGRFRHEAVGIDPATGTAYLTEDGYTLDGVLTSFLFRYVPHRPLGGPGSLHEGGALSALAIDRAGADADGFATRQSFAVTWQPIADPDDARGQALASGCLRFSRLEGADFGRGALWFSDTSGGGDGGADEGPGQVYRYRPADERLELVLEGREADDRDTTAMDEPDNVVVTPWGDLWFVEDGDGDHRVQGLTPAGDVYTFARNRTEDSELAGPCFAPDGRTFFVNVQTPGHTLAVWGPFERYRR